MKTLQVIFAGSLLAISFLGCQNRSQRAADDSIDQAQDVNDTTAMVNEQDAEFAVKAADANLSEIELGKVAAAKATDQRLKDFAQKMIDDHQLANDELLTIATKHNITLPPVMSEEHVAKQMELQDKKGRAFDQAYIRMMVNDHDDAVSLFEDAASDARNMDLQAFAAKILPKLKQHFEEAKSLRDSISPVDSTTVQRIMP